MKKTICLLIALCFSSGLSEAASKGWMPEILDADSRDYLPDYSYAGYHNGEKALPSLKPTLQVTDFGAVPDDGKDDTAAIKEAIASAAANDRPDVIEFPKGRFIVSDILIINHSHLVLQGAGSGPDGTKLYFPKALNELPLQPESKVLLEYITKENKRHGKEFFSPFSWAGGLIWTKSAEYGGTDVLADAVAGTRGKHLLTVKDSSRLKPGTSVLLQWFNRDGQTGSFLSHWFMAEKHKCGSRFYESPDKPMVLQPVQIIAVNGNTVTIKEPLLHDVRPEWTPELVAFKPLTEIGIEKLCIEFPARTRKWKHHLEDGFNGIYLTEVRNAWVRAVEVRNADSAILIEKTASLTSTEDVRITGNVMGHYTIECGGYGNLIKNFEFTAPAGHNPSFNTGCNYCVYTHGSVDRPILDQHCGGNHQNLIDDVQLTTAPSKLFSHGGAPYYYPAAGAYNTFWNLFVESGAAKIGGLNEKCPAWHTRIVGLHGKQELTLKYSASAYIEGLNRGEIAVPSLYEYQLNKRLNK
jgi:hypothetical protein